MASWDANPNWQDPNEINSGNKYEGGDGLVYGDVNKIVEDLKYLETKVSVDSTTTAVSTVATNNKDESFTAANISSLSVTIPTSFTHGKAYGLNFKTGATSPTFNVTLASGVTLPFKFMQYGFASNSYTPKANANVSMIFINNGINILCFISET